MIPLWSFADLICTENSGRVFVLYVDSLSRERFNGRSCVVSQGRRLVGRNLHFYVLVHECYLLFLLLRDVKTHSAQHSVSGPIPQNSIHFPRNRLNLNWKRGPVWYGMVSRYVVFPYWAWRCVMCIRVLYCCCACNGFCSVFQGMFSAVCECHLSELLLSTCFPSPPLLSPCSFRT